MKRLLADVGPGKLYVCIDGRGFEREARNAEFEGNLSRRRRVHSVTSCRSREGEYIQPMMIELPDADIESLNLTPEQARFQLAVGLYAGREVTLGRAAKIAGLTYAAFMKEVGRRGLCINYTEQDALDDISQLRRRSSK
jgi:predicted HTH domain antitoxin